jgi:hypothetical protein
MREDRESPGLQERAQWLNRVRELQARRDAAALEPPEVLEVPRGRPALPPLALRRKGKARSS